LEIDALLIQAARKSRSEENQLRNGASRLTRGVSEPLSLLDFDRIEVGMRKPVFSSKEFWLGFATVFICIALAFSLAPRFAG
jgi:hypothetical protein